MPIYMWREYVPDYLCFTAESANSTVALNKEGNPTAVTLETSIDGGTWNSYTIGDTITLTNIGDKVYFRTTSETDTGLSTSASDYYQFSFSGSIAGSGDVTYLVNKNGTNTIPNYGLCRLFFRQSALTTAPFLPATTIGNYSYYQMFYKCSGLTTVPNIPATSLGNHSCYYMFWGCSGLEALPKLPATSLNQYCYYSMFEGCDKIKLSTTQTGEYQTPYRIPDIGTGTNEYESLSYMFNGTGGTFTGTPSINTTYYTSNTVV